MPEEGSPHLWYQFLERNDVVKEVIKFKIGHE
jgi:hypothetical protein